MIDSSDNALTHPQSSMSRSSQLWFELQAKGLFAAKTRRARVDGSDSKEELVHTVSVNAAKG